MPDGTIPELVTRSDALLLRAVRAESREVDFIASTDAVDAYEEIVDQASWRLERFKANPVVLYGHQSYELPIGQATRCEVANGRLEVTIKFATEDANPRAEQVWQLVQQKVLRAVSVGFRPTDGKYELRDGKEVFVMYGCDLREISVVAVPANPECLSKMKMLAREQSGTQTQPSVAPASDPTIERAGQGATETRMDPKELLARIDTLISEKTTLQQSEKAAVDKADAAEARVKALETELATAKSEKDVLAKEHEKACTDRDAATKRADDAEGKLVELEVDALIGKKITAAEKDDFVTMRKNLPDTFKSIVGKRPDLKLTEQVTASDTKGAANGALTADPSNLLNEL